MQSQVALIEQPKKHGYMANLANSLECRLERLLDGLSHYTSECDGKYLELFWRRWLRTVCPVRLKQSRLSQTVTGSLFISKHTPLSVSHLWQRRGNRVPDFTGPKGIQNVATQSVLSRRWTELRLIYRDLVSHLQPFTGALGSTRADSNLYISISNA